MSLLKTFFVFSLFISPYAICANNSNGIDTFTVLGNKYLIESVSRKSSSSVLNQSDLNIFPNGSLQDLSQLVPGVTFTGGTAKGRFFQIRGVGERSSYEGMPNYSVGIVYDGIDYSGFGNVISFNGVEEIIVQKGPQMVSQGPSGIGGMILLNSSPIEADLAGGLSLNYGTYGAKVVSASLSGPIHEKLGFSLVSQISKSDGYIENKYFPKSETNSIHDKFVKGKMSFESAKWDINLNLHHFSINQGYDVFNHSNSRVTYSDHPGTDRNEINAISLKMDREMDYLLSSTTLSFLRSKSLYSYDEDWSNDEFWNGLQGYNANYNYYISFPKEQKRMALDHRFYFNGKSSNSHIGFYIKNENELNREWGFKNEIERKNISSNLDIEQKAIYGQFGIDLSNSSQIILGGRIENRESKYSDSQAINVNPVDNLWGVEASYLFTINEHMKSYLKFSRGFKAGGVNTQPSIEENRKEFKDEKVYLIESGLEYLRDQNNFLKGSVYYMDRRDIQVKTSYQDNPSDPSSYTFYQDNGSDARVFGAEIEGKHKVIDNLNIKYSLGLMESKFGNYVYGERNLKGRELAYSPNYQFNFSLNYTTNHGYFFNILNSLQDNVYFGNSHDEKSKTTQISNISFGKDFRWGQINFWCQNIFNERTELRGFYFSNEPPDWENRRYVHVGPPRLFGVKMSYQF